VTTHTDDPARATAAPIRSQTLGLGELQCVGDIRILILDDDPSICALIQAALAHPDFRIDAVTVPSAIEAHLQRHRPSPRPAGDAASEAGTGSGEYHLVILDYVLPGVEPEQVFGWLREYQPDASVLVVTAHPSVESALKSLRARAYDYLTKPFQVQQLRDVVLRCLESKGLLRMTEEALRLSLGAAIRERRKALDLTLAKMAERTQVSLGYLSQIELGKNSASIETLYRICLALGIKMADLFQAVQRPG
jgi:DNA-binding response OmpR family regulator